MHTFINVYGWKSVELSAGFITHAWTLPAWDWFICEPAWNGFYHNQKTAAWYINYLKFIFFNFNHIKNDFDFDWIDLKNSKPED